MSPSLCILTLHTWVRKRQNRGRRKLSLEFPTNPGRWMEANTCCRDRIPNCRALKACVGPSTPRGLTAAPQLLPRLSPCPGLQLGEQRAGGLEERGQHQQSWGGGWWHQVVARAGMGNPRSEHLTCGVELPHVHQQPLDTSGVSGSPALQGKASVGLNLWGSVLREPWELAQAAAC